MTQNARYDMRDITITVVYDNNPYKEGLETGWGFSCLITGTEKIILFDTGGAGSILLNNMEKLGIKPNNIDIVVLSHIHGDHTGGLGSFLEKNSNVTVYLPKSFPKRFKDNVASCGAKIVEVERSLKICENVHSAGQLGKWIKEQPLIIRTDNGLIVITGCAHPGIVNPVRSSGQLGTDAECPTSNGVNTAKDLIKDNILLPAPMVPAPVVPAQVAQAQVVMGGFHLEWATKSKIERIISTFKRLNVRYVGPCHCTGDKARTLFEKHFGKNYINVGAGKVITTADLQ